MDIKRIFLILALSSLTIGGAKAEQVTIAVASNFSNPAQKIAHAFEQQTPHQVRLVFGSSGKIYAQITHGAPFDIFLSADQAKPLALDKNGLSVTGSRFTYALGQLILWDVKHNHPPNLSKLGNEGYFRKLALANPKLAPYGLAAKEVLQSLKLYKKLSPKLVMGENIAQTYQFVASGNADMGFVASSQITKKMPGIALIIPDHLYRPIRQDAILLNRAEHNSAARDFMRFLKSEKAQKIIISSGYLLWTELE